MKFFQFQFFQSRSCNAVVVFPGSNVPIVTRVIEQIVRVPRTNEHTAETKVPSVSRPYILSTDEMQPLYIADGWSNETGCCLRSLWFRLSHAML